METSIPVNVEELCLGQGGHKNERKNRSDSTQEKEKKSKTSYGKQSEADFNKKEKWKTNSCQRGMKIVISGFNYVGAP